MPCHAMPCHTQCMGVSQDQDQDHVTCNYHLTRTRLSLVPLHPPPLRQPSPSTAIDEQREAHTRIKKNRDGTRGRKPVRCVRAQ